ncbi:hypothetical protein BGZ83_001173 [Gryganskiella cystojenkinii]|nr:hypothetical protein BGZ83_001173 [Gryganskiella cystojenkinii]
MNTFDPETLSTPGSTPGASFSSGTSASLPSTSSLFISTLSHHRTSSTLEQLQQLPEPRIDFFPQGFHIEANTERGSNSGTNVNNPNNVSDINNGNDNNNNENNNENNKLERDVVVKPASVTEPNQNYSAEDSLSTGPLLHYYYEDNNNLCTVQTVVTEPETPSPILAPWDAAAGADQIDFDYLTPYHPSHHKSVQDWSQLLLEQIRQKGGHRRSPSTRRSIIEAVAHSANAITSASALPHSSILSHSPSTSSSSARAKKESVEKHTVIQCHHRPPHSSDPKQQHQQHQQHHEQQRQQQPHPQWQQQQQQRHSMEQQQQPKIRLPTDQKSQSTKSKKSSRRLRSTRSINHIIGFFKRLVKSLMGKKDPKDKTKNKSKSKGTKFNQDKGKGKSANTHDLTDADLNYLSVSDDDDDHHYSSHDELEDYGDQSAGTGVGEGSETISKMNAEVGRISKHDNHDPSVDHNTQQQGPHQHHHAQSSSSKATERMRGPKMHPTLLELFTITDHVLGVGTFATVKEIKLKSTGKSYALKIIMKSSLSDKVAMLETEINVLSRVRHPNCVSLLELFETEDAVYLVTDLAAGGELFDQLLKKGYYTEGDAARLVREILLGVEYLHSLDIVHRDLKPENLLFADKSETARLMITDFGLSKVLTNGNDVLMTACGTPGYVAPEVLEQVGHGKPVDMWSVGVIAYTLLCGYTPFWGEDQSALFDHIMTGEHQYEDTYWKDISALAKSFIDTLLIRPAERRYTATQALAHPWFRAMLDQDLAAPASPQDSVNLLPAVRKNFDARNVFKKAVRAVGLLRRMQGNGQNSVEPASVTAAAFTTTETSPPGSASGSPSGGKVMKFHDLVNAALFSKKGANMNNASDVTTLEEAATEGGDDRDLTHIHKALDKLRTKEA